MFEPVDGVSSQLDTEGVACLEELYRVPLLHAAAPPAVPHVFQISISYI